MTSRDLTALIHLAGFGTGIVLYAMLAAMTARRGSGAGGESLNRIPLAAAVLGLLWNAGALVIYALRDFGLGEPAPLLLSLAFVALGFLPAVVVHSACRPLSQSTSQRWLVGASYVISGITGVLQIVGASRNAAPSRAALITLTVGYALVLVTLAWTARGRPGWQRMLTVVTLAAFAVSALHLTHNPAQRDSILAALLGHHSSLPLVMVILYQDYRFAFADLFLRRGLSLVVLVGLAVTLQIVAVVSGVATATTDPRESLLATGVYVALWVATALAYPWIRRAVGVFVDRVILERRDYRRVRDDVAATIVREHEPERILDGACQVLRPALGAHDVRWCVDEASAPAAHHIVVSPRGGRDARDRALARVPTTDAPSYAIEVDGLTGGRRLLSDDLALLESVALLVGRRIDAVRVTRERFARDLREREITQLAAEAELRALRAQLNPHFLFNALTTIGYLMRAAPDRALGTLYRLTELLRAVLRRPSGELVTLGEELDIIESYLAIERERFEERLTVEIDVGESLRTLTLPPLLLQPLVENAVKHGIAPLKRGGRLRISAAVEPTSVPVSGSTAHKLCVTIADSGTGFGLRPGGGRPRGLGLGLSSVEQRLERYFGNAASLTFATAPAGGTRVELRIPVASAEAHERPNVVAG